MAKGNNINIGNCGEYFVAGELERRGWHVAVPMSNVPSFDLLAIDKDDLSKQIAIQVKTTDTQKLEWATGEKNEHISATNIFYVFVLTNQLGYPEYYIVPSEIVAEYTRESHKAWCLESPTHDASLKLRKFRIYDDRYFKCDYSKYKDAWDLLRK